MTSDIHHTARTAGKAEPPMKRMLRGPLYGSLREVCSYRDTHSGPSRAERGKRRWQPAKRLRAVSSGGALWLGLMLASVAVLSQRAPVVDAATAPTFTLPAAAELTAFVGDT